MPVASDASTGGKKVTPSSDILAEIRKLAAAPKASPVVVQPVAAMREPAVQGYDAPMFNPTASIAGGRVNNDDWYGKLLGSVYADVPIRSAWDKLRMGFGYGRDNGVVATGDTLAPSGYANQGIDAPGNFGGNVYGDRTGDYTQTGNSKGPIMPDNYKYEPLVVDKSGRQVQPQGTQKIRGFADLGPGLPATQEQTDLAAELGMATGALTTVPEVEQESTGVPAWDARIEQAMKGTSTRTAGEGTPGMGSRAGSTISVEEVQAETEEDVADQAERRDRTKRNALNQGGSRKRTTALTSEEYAKLSPKQKAAVDLNTLLVTAIREDLAGKKLNSDTAGGKEYDAQVAEVFGEKHAADAAFVPQTMQVLDDIGFKGDGTRLDDILKLKVGLTAADIEDLKPRKGSKDASLMTPQKVRDNLTAALVKDFRKQRVDPQRGAALLETQRDVLNTREAFDFGSPENNQIIEAVYEQLANPQREYSIDQLMSEARKMISEEDWPMFIAFLDTRSREAVQYDNELGLNSETDYMKPKQFRSRLGL